MEKQNKIRNYSEADLILLYNLERRVGNDKSPLLQDWLNCKTTLTPVEQAIFEMILTDAQQNIDGWHEEELKMKFIAFVLRLGQLNDTVQFHTYFERTVSATLEGHFLKTKTDFMVAKGILDKPQQPYFHFQGWKPHKRPTGDSMAQLLEALLIAQHLNEHKFPLYGCEVVGKYWSFVILENKSYYISKGYDCTEQDDLLQIIAILRKFKEILLTTMLV
jgi:hypothetical protein